MSPLHYFFLAMFLISTASDSFGWRREVDEHGTWWYDKYPEQIRRAADIGIVTGAIGLLVTYAI